MRTAPALLAWIALLAPALAPAGAPEGGATNVKMPGYDPETGELIWVLHAARLDPVPGNDRLLDGTEVRIEVHDTGVTHVATGRRGRVDTQSKTGTLEGNVVIRFGDEQATRVETDALAWDGARGTASTDSPVTIVRKDMTITGVGLRLRLRKVKEPDTKPVRADEIVIQRRVRVLIEPTTQSWLLPIRKPAPPKTAKPAEPAPETPAEPKPPADPPPPKGPAEAKDPAKAAAPANAEPPGEPIVITCTGSLTVLRLDAAAIFRDNVRAVQGEKSLTSDQLTLLFTPTKDGGQKATLERAIASGHVVIDDTETVTLADRATWVRQENSTELVGQPAEVRWDNGARLAAPVIRRLQDGREFYCAPTPKQGGAVYLMSFIDKSALAPPRKDDVPPAPQPPPGR